MLPFTIIVNHSYNNNKKINCHFKCLLCPFKCSVNLFNSPMKLLKIIFNHTWLSFFSNLTSYPPAHLAGSTFKNVFHYILNIYRNIYSHILVHLWPGLLEEPPTEALTLLSLSPFQSILHPCKGFCLKMVSLFCSKHSIIAHLAEVNIKSLL